MFGTNLLKEAGVVSGNSNLGAFAGELEVEILGHSLEAIESMKLEVDMDKLEATALGLESILNSVSSKREEGLDQDAARLLAVAVANQAAVIGVEIDMPGIESFGEEAGSVYATTLSIESIADTLRKVVDAIKAFLRKAIKAAVAFVKKTMMRLDGLEKKAKAIQELKTEGKPEDSTVKIGSSAAILDVDGKVAKPSDIANFVKTIETLGKGKVIVPAVNDIAKALDSIDIKDLEGSSANLVTAVNELGNVSNGRYGLKGELSDALVKEYKIDDKFNARVGEMLPGKRSVVAVTPKTGVVDGATPYVMFKQVGETELKEADVLSPEEIKEMGVQVEKLVGGIRSILDGYTPAAEEKLLAAADKAARKMADADGNTLAAKAIVTTIKGIRKISSIARATDMAIAAHAANVGAAASNYAISSNKAYKSKK